MDPGSASRRPENFGTRTDERPPRPAVEPIVRTRVRAIAFGQIAPRDPGPQPVKYCIYDPSIVRARALRTLRHQRLKNRPFLIAEIESHDPPPPAVNHDPCCFSVNYAGTDPSLVLFASFFQSALVFRTSKRRRDAAPYFPRRARIASEYAAFSVLARLSAHGRNSGASHTTRSGWDCFILRR